MTVSTTSASQTKTAGALSRAAARDVADGANGDTRPFSPFEWLLAMRYLRARRKEGFISVIAGFSFIGIMLGVATLIIVMAVMNGFRTELFGKILGLNGHIIAAKGGIPLTDWRQTASRLQSIAGVTHVLPLIEAQVLASSPAHSSGAMVRGVPESGLKSLPILAGNVRFGTIDGFDTAEGIAIGIRLANNMGVTFGDTITLVSPRGATTPFGTSPRTKQYKIVAVFEAGMSEYDKSIIFMPLPEAQKFFNRGETVDVLELLIADPDNVERYAAKLTEADPQIVSQHWKERNATFIEVLRIERFTMFIILSLIIIVAALNIISGMMMLVKDKGRDIAVLRTMGASAGAIMRVFLITGAAIGVVGTLAGFVLGIVFCWNIEEVRQAIQWLSGRTVFDPNVYYLSKMPVAIDPWETGGIVVMALLISVLATLYPSWRAAKLDPVEALRYE